MAANKAWVAMRNPTAVRAATEAKRKVVTMVFDCPEKFQFIGGFTLKKDRPF